MKWEQCQHKCQWQLKRLIVYAGGIPMIIGFFKQSVLQGFDSSAFITFPLGLIILYMPQLALHLLRAWKGSLENERQDQEIPQAE